ncbi:MAG TPA: hypothetical protein DCM54_09350 [Gammaproteobacteria bacterium]|nr:hypothetical protein [Gammaproteobacteria bacterium]
MKKIILWIAGVVLGILVALFGLQMLASERVEVIELHTIAEDGETYTTRLWVVDHEGVPYLRAGMEESGWLVRGQQNGSVSVTRAGATKVYVMQPRTAMRDTVNSLLAEKYTWGYDVINFMFRNEDSAIPVALIEQ